MGYIRLEKDLNLVKSLLEAIGKMEFSFLVVEGRDLDSQGNVFFPSLNFLLILHLTVLRDFGRTAITLSIELRLR